MNKMKIIILITLVILSLLFNVVESRTKSKTKTHSKNHSKTNVKNKSKWIGGAIRGPSYIASPYRSSYFSRPAIIARPALYSPTVFPRYYSPYFRWRWLSGIPGYSYNYIVSNRRSCSGICESLNPGCTSLRTSTTTNGTLQCTCDATGQQNVVTQYCWTPRACIKSLTGCNSIYSRLLTRVSDIQRRR